MSNVRMWIDQHRLLSFVAIAYAFTWTIQGALALINRSRTVSL